MDPETNFDGVRNVGIKGNRIVKITEEKITGKETIDAKGHVVAPGFINTHTHSFAPFGQKIMVRDGTTTILDTELGVADVSVFYRKYQGKMLLNFGVSVGHEPVRIVVLDGVDIKLASDPTFGAVSRGAAEKKDGRANWALDIPNKEQTTRMMAMYERGLRDGAIGVSSTVGYMGYGVTTRELFDLQKLAKKFERIFGAHTRFGPTESLPLHYSLGTREIIANAVAIDGALLLSHIQNQGWQEIYFLARALQDRGMVIFPEFYPSIYGNPNIATPGLKPDKIKLNNVNIATDIIDPVTGKNYTEAQFFKEQKEQPSKTVFLLLRPKEDMPKWVHMKDTAIANDIMAVFLPNGKLPPITMPYKDYKGHPRNPGTYGKVFRMAREQKVPLMDIVHNASYTPAKYLSKLELKAMQERGRMQEGMIADITIFNPETITDNSSFKMGEQGLPTTGIPYVLISGKVVVRDSKVDIEATPGQPIRYPVMKKGDDPKKYAK